MRSVEGPPGRKKWVADHDRHVLAWLQESTGFKPATEVVLCTWDLRFREGNGTRNFLSLDPSTLTDLIELLRPAEQRRPLVNIPAIAASIRDETAQRAAEIFDQVLQFHRKQAFPIELRRAAKAFKNEWLARHPADLPSEADWQSFLVAGHY